MTKVGVMRSITLKEVVFRRLYKGQLCQSHQCFLLGPYMRSKTIFANLLWVNGLGLQARVDKRQFIIIPIVKVGNEKKAQCWHILLCNILFHSCANHILIQTLIYIYKVYIYFRMHTSNLCIHMCMYKHIYTHML